MHSTKKLLRLRTSRLSIKKSLSAGVLLQVVGESVQRIAGGLLNPAENILSPVLSGGMTACKVIPIILHVFVSPGFTPDILHGVVSPDLGIQNGVVSPEVGIQPRVG